MPTSKNQSHGRDLRVPSHLQAGRSLSSGSLCLLEGLNSRGRSLSATSQICGSLLSSDRVPSLNTIFSVAICITTVTPSSPLSFARGDMTPPSAMAVSAPWARDDGLISCSDSSRPPRGCGCNSFLPCPYYVKKNYPANKCWRQFGKSPSAQAVVDPLATLSPALLGTPTPHYHVTLTSAR